MTSFITTTYLCFCDLNTEQLYLINVKRGGSDNVFHTPLETTPNLWILEF